MNLELNENKVDSNNLEFPNKQAQQLQSKSLTNSNLKEAAKSNKVKIEEEVKPINTELLKVDLSKLKKHITCSLCSGIYRNPITINECMHTFCKACLFKEFFNKPNNTVCPKCNINLGGKPWDSFIVDNSINSLINILFPEFEQIDIANTEKMYQAFRNVGTPLPGDPEQDKKKKPSIQISVLPHKHENSNQLLPKLDSTKIQVAPNMDMLKFKKYLSFKLKQMKCEIQETDLSVYYKNHEMRDDFSFLNIEKQYGFPTNKQDKIVFSYAKK